MEKTKIRNGFPTFEDEVMGVGYDLKWRERLFGLDRGIRNIACWNCKKEFQDGQVVFCPDDKRDGEQIRGLSFCNPGCAMNFESIHENLNKSI